VSNTGGLHDPDYGIGITGAIPFGWLVTHIALFAHVFLV
jgi:hypothetical protein